MACVRVVISELRKWSPTQVLRGKCALYSIGVLQSSEEVYEKNNNWSRET